jgi:hypothetical protein
MLSTLPGGYSDQVPPTTPHLSAPEQGSSLDSLAQSSHILRTPELSALEVNFDQLHHSSTVPSRSDPSQGGMAPTSPRTSSQVDGRSSVLRKRDHVHKGGEWRKKYTA